MLILVVPQQHDSDPILKLRINPEPTTAGDTLFHYELVDADAHTLIAGSGRPARSTGPAPTVHQAARALATSLANDGERLAAHAGNPEYRSYYDADARAVLITNHERFRQLGLGAGNGPGTTAPTFENIRAEAPPNAAPATAPGLDPAAVATLTMSLHIVNAYEFYPSVEVCVIDAVIAACPIGHLPHTNDEHRAFDAWAEDHIYTFTGAGHTDGDSWYDVTVTACSVAWLVGYTFAWGY